MLSKIALGTVQFGLSYGIANTEGQVGRTEAAAILSLAARRGINTLDTAVAYGESEQVLGEVGVDSWRVISKLPAVPEDCVDVQAWVDLQVSNSLQRLQMNHLHGLLLHRPGQLLEARGEVLYRALRVLQDRGVVEKIGVSIYEPAELSRLTTNMRFDVVQAPLSIFDTRLTDSGWLARLTDSGCEVHTRSSFLQGLLLMKPEDRPQQFKRWDELWKKWDSWLLKVGLTPLQACLRYALSQQGVAKVVLGVNSEAQLGQIFSAAVGDLPPIPAEMKTDDQFLLNPALWTNT